MDIGILVSSGRAHASGTCLCMSDADKVHDVRFVADVPRRCRCLLGMFQGQRESLS